MLRTTALFCALSLLSQLSAGAAAATDASDPRITAVLSELEQTRRIHQVALAPDGEWIAWVVDREAGSEIQIASTKDPSHPHRLSASAGQTCIEENPAWAPDSRSLAFTSNCNSPEQAEIYVAAPTSGTTLLKPKTHLHGGLTTLAFSPDGQRIACLYIEGATRPAGALAAMKPPSGVIGVEGLEIQRVGVLEVASDNFRQVTPDNLHVFEFDWAPDGQHLAYTAAPPPGENNWWVAQLYTQSLSDAQPKSILDPARTPGLLHGLQIAVPRWSPDQTQLAFIGGLMSDQSVTGGDIYVVPANGGEAKDITQGTDKSAAWIDWRKPRSGIVGGTACCAQPQLLVSWIKAGKSEISEIDLNGKPGPHYATLAATVWDGRFEQGLSVAQDLKVAYIQDSFSQAPEVYLGTLGSPAQAVTHYNDRQVPLWGKSESIEWTNEHFSVQGWLLYPAHYDPSKKYPMIVSVHGGPSSAVLPRWPSLGYNATAFSALDYFVLMPNPRGSYGEGEQFTQANRKDFGYGDLRDILTGVDAVSGKFPIDPDRVGLTGWSYGGFMTMFAVTQTQRFRAAVAGAGIANWQSYYGENSIDEWMPPFFGATVYDDPAVYAKSSAINFIGKVKTPTLVVVGDRDGECPAPQSFEFWHALRAEKVPTELVVYPDEGHRFENPEHRRDVLARALAWFEQHMPAKS
jgi:dipeptidyl aminopeptidase/acylaminoacyl peptidase